MIHPDFRIKNKKFSSYSFPEFLGISKKAGGIQFQMAKFIEEWLNDNSYVLVYTSGSTGIPKEIRLEKKFMKNSAVATNTYFNLDKNTKALLCMSPEYIAGKMMIVRAMIGGWDLHYTEASRNPLSGPEIFDFTAMVPFQVYHSIDDLEKVKKTIIGGGAVSPDLEKKLQNIKTDAFATYGMTETISHIAIRKINGEDKSANYKALPNVLFDQTAENCLIIHAPKISAEPVVTNDVVELISSSEFRFLGRLDNVINSGGIKIHPEELEQKLNVNIVEEFFVASEKDEALGEKLVLIIQSENHDPEKYRDVLEALHAYEKPKKIYFVPKFEYTETGKIKRKEILKKIGLE